tara:strand:+ start:173 stop:1015 length:843 start_codon:yes stop_codon:yes gene_type:complete
MDVIVNYFNTISTLHRTFFLVGGLTFLLILESGLPLFKMKYRKTKHAMINFFYTGTTIIINLIGATLILWAVEYNSYHSAGILNKLSLPLWASIILGLLILDFIGAWLVHWVEHRVKWMWKFHVIHHSDRYVDATTGLRHHPGEAVFRLLFTSLAVFVSGASFGIVMLYQTISGFFAHLTHTNIRAIDFLDPILSKVFVTPNFHKIHHHYILPHTDHNYGNIFSLWDHLFGTSIKVDDMGMIRYGIDTHMDTKETENIKTMLKIPFKEYRPPVGAKFNTD